MSALAPMASFASRNARQSVAKANGDPRYMLRGIWSKRMTAASQFCGVSRQTLSKFLDRARCDA